MSRAEANNHVALPTLPEGTLKRPRALSPGDRIGIIAPSCPTAVWFPDRFDRSVEAFARELQAEAVIAGQVRRATGFTSGSVAERARAFQEMLEDRSIRAIFSSIGGFNSAELLEHLDVDRFRSDPKIVIGYSDCTSLLLGIQAMAGWYTFYGPAVMTQFGEYPRPLPYTLEWLRRTLVDAAAPGDVHDPEEWTNEFLDWAGTEWLSRARRPSGPARRAVWKSGDGDGRLFGGNIETLNFLIGTSYLRVPERVVLFWETTDAEASLPRVQRALTHFRQTGLLDRTAAMLIGRSPDSTNSCGTSLQEVVLAAVQSYDFPVVAELAFGHTDPMLTLPIGARTLVTAHGDHAAIALTEPGVVSDAAGSRNTTSI
jgi:muramoyltetrapeptide carboxypeptidase